MLREQLSYSGCLSSPVPLIGFNPSTRHPVRTKYPGLCYCKFLVFPLSLLLQKQSLLVLFVCLLNLTGARIWGFGFYKVIPSGMSQEDKRASKNLKSIYCPSVTSHAQSRERPVIKIIMNVVLKHVVELCQNNRIPTF